jgi:purine nucleoside permease
MKKFVAIAVMLTMSACGTNAPSPGTTITNLTLITAEAFPCALAVQKAVSLADNNDAKALAAASVVIGPTADPACTQLDTATANALVSSFGATSGPAPAKPVTVLAP